MQQQQHRAGQHTLLIVQTSVEQKHEITYLVPRNQTKHAKLVVYLNSYHTRIIPDINEPTLLQTILPLPPVAAAANATD